MATISRFLLASPPKRLPPQRLYRRVWPVGTVAAAVARHARRRVNQIFFASKRAFHGILRVMRKPLLSLGLTAARFDLLYALMADGTAVGLGRRQSELRRSLGVCGSVVSRMLTSLEKLGWVTRSRFEPCADRRQRWVTLTDTGLKCITAAFRMLRRASWRLVHEAICFGKHRDPSAQFEHTEQLESYLREMRLLYRDTATLAYPWHPDD